MTDGARLPGADRPAAQALPPGLGPWGERVSLVHGLVSGRPLGEISLHDFPSMEYGDNFFIAGGYGAYLARLAAGLRWRSRPRSAPSTGPGRGCGSISGRAAPCGRGRRWSPPR